MFYSGSCAIDGDRFTATVTTKRHADGNTVFGNNEELTLTLAGTCLGAIAEYAGTAEQFPGVVLKGTLIRSEQQPAAETDTPQSFDPSRLPKLPKRLR
jgi:hypothetical protein